MKHTKGFILTGCDAAKETFGYILRFRCGQKT